MKIILCILFAAGLVAVSKIVLDSPTSCRIPTAEEIAVKAYEIWQANGSREGDAQTEHYWLVAESMLKQSVKTR